MTGVDGRDDLLVAGGAHHQLRDQRTPQRRGQRVRTPQDPVTGAHVRDLDREHVRRPGPLGPADEQRRLGRGLPPCCERGRQGAKPGGGGMLLGQKISDRVAEMRDLDAVLAQWQRASEARGTTKRRAELSAA